MRSLPLASFALLALATATLTGCGYGLVGTTSALPEHIRDIVVMPFENMTTRPEIEQRVTEATASELSRRSRYEVVTDRNAADAVLEGAVTSYRTSPVAFTPDGRASRVEVVVTIRATLRATATDEVLWSQQGLIFKEQYDVPPLDLNPINEEDPAQLEIAEGVAGALITSIFEGF
jgi:outer membrane lipopolysaccharide assembly protein LptE/RlpB